MSNRKLEKYVVETSQWIGESIALVSTEGVVICRPANIFKRIPEIGNHLELEVLADDGCRVTGLLDGETWLFRYSDTEIAEQDRAAIAAITAAQQKETP